MYNSFSLLVSYNAINPEEQGNNIPHPNRKRMHVMFHLVVIVVVISKR